MVAFICNLCWLNSTSSFNSKINIFIFRCADPETLDYYYFADRTTRNNSPDFPYNKNLSYLRISVKTRTDLRKRKYFVGAKMGVIST